MWTFLPSSSLRISGNDRLDFVQGQMTNDLRSAPTHSLLPVCFLNVRGQIELFAYIYKRTNDIYIHLAINEADQLAARFKKYIIFDQVNVENTSQTLSTLHLWQPALGVRFGWQLDGANVQEVEWQGLKLLLGQVKRSDSQQAGLDLHVLSSELATVKAALADQSEASIEKLQAARVVAGLPDVAQDRWQGLLMPEVGLDVKGPLPSISYNKGCYVGQEIMARLEARGKARYGLALLQATEGQKLTDYAEVTEPSGKNLGRLGWSATGQALARLRKDSSSKLLAEDVELKLVRWL